MDDERCGEGELTYNTGDVYRGRWSEEKQSASEPPPPPPLSPAIQGLPSARLVHVNGGIYRTVFRQ